MRLADSEHVIVRTRAHPRSLLGPAAVLILTAGALAYAIGTVERAGLPSIVEQSRSLLIGLAWVIAGVLVAFGVVRPVWRWTTRTLVMTSQRLVQKQGLTSASELSMPLPTIAAVERRRRGASAGDLHVTFQDGYQQVFWRITNIPEVDRFEDELAAATRHARAADAGVRQEW
ncbi:MAG: PH domain-containing protein [Micrococcus sp.]|nr:PH domain-containing protein [Micrococcus sp.]